MALYRSLVLRDRSGHTYREAKPFVKRQQVPARPDQARSKAVPARPGIEAESIRFAEHAHAGCSVKAAPVG